MRWPTTEAESLTWENAQSLQGSSANFFKDFILVHYGFEFLFPFSGCRRQPPAMGGGLGWAVEAMWALGLRAPGLLQEGEVPSSHRDRMYLEEELGCKSSHRKSS